MIRVLLVLVVATSIAHGAPDQKLAKWASDFRAGRIDSVIASLEAELRTEKPHPQAAVTWMQLQTLLGQHDQAIAKLDPALARTLAPLATLWKLTNSPEAALQQVDARAAKSAGNAVMLEWSSLAASAARYSERIQMLRDLFARTPDDFEVAEALHVACRALPLQREKCVADAIAAVSKTAATAWMSTLSAATLWDDHIAATSTYLASQPDDVEALYYRARGLYSRQWYDRALADFSRAAELDPFNRWLVIGKAKILSRLGKFDEAKKAITEWAQGLPAARREVVIAISYARALYDDGERRRAREELEKIVVRWPQEPDGLAWLSEMDAADARPREAIPNARKCLALATRGDCANTLVSSLLADGRPDEALREVAAIEAKHAIKLGLLNYRLDALDRLGRAAERISVLEEATRRYPELPWIRFVLADARLAAKQVDGGITALQEALAISPSEWQRSGAFEKLDGLKGPQLVDTMLLELTKKYPTIAEPWADRANRAATPEAKAAIWADARRTAPDLTQGLDAQLEKLIGDEKFDEAAKLADAQLTNAKRPSLRENLLSWKLFAVYRKRATVGISKDEAQHALDELDASYKLVGQHDQYLRFRTSFLAALGRKKDAAETAVLRAELMIDDSNTNAALFESSDDLDSDVVARSKWSLVYRYFDRDPYSVTRANYVVNRYVGWGSPVLGMWAVAEARAHQLESTELTFWEGKALDQFGASDRAWQKSYARSSTISPSERYLSWYRGMRRRAVELPTLVAIPNDPSTAANCPLDRARKLVTPGSKTFVVICHPTGEVSVREDDLVSGKPLLIATGAAWVRVKYRDGRATGFFTSSGESLELFYASSGDIDVVQHHKDRFRLVKGTDGKVEKVVFEGHGTFDAQTGEWHDTSGKKLPPERSDPMRQSMSQSFTMLTTLNSIFNTSYGSPPDIPFEDKKLAELYKRTDEKGQLSIASYMLAHLEDRPSYVWETQYVLRTLSHGSSSATAIKAIALLDELYRRVRPAGLAAEEYVEWQGRLTWLAQQKGAEADKLRSRLRAKPHELVKQGQWLPRSSLQNKGLWRRVPETALVPRVIGNVEIKAMLVRKNGDVVIGTSGGIAVMRQGFWEWFVFDAKLGHWSRDLALSRDAHSDVHSLTESADDALWIGTRDGLLRVASDYLGELQRIDGLPSPRISFLAAMGEGVFVGTERGAVAVTKSAAPMSIRGLESTPIVMIDGSARGKNDALLVSTADGLYAITAAVAARIDSQPARYAIYDAVHERIIAVHGRAVEIANYTGTLGPWRTIPGAENIDGKTVSGLVNMRVADNGDAVAIETERGISFFRDEHIESFQLPHADRYPGVQMIASQRGRSVLATTAGVYLFELGLTKVVPGAAQDLLSAPDLGLTFVATGNSLGVVVAAEPQRGVQQVDTAAATRLTRGPDGTIYSNNGNVIISFDPITAISKELFEARPKTQDCVREDTLRAIHAAKDGTLWVVAGASVFRWANGKAEEFNFETDHNKFDIRTDCIANVVETIDGKIWVIGSAEGHRSINGVTLSGGMVEWDGSKFVRLKKAIHPDSAWFISSYTPLGDGTAIAGTAAGFAQHDRSGLTTFVEQNDPSYKKLVAEHPALMLGTRGVGLTGGLWLFGSSAGIIGYRDNVWFYPQRVNWLLPEAGAADRGERAINALAVDSAGNIIAATDAGLMIYEAGGRDAAAFLVAEEQPQAAFATVAHKALLDEASVLLPSIPKGSADYALVQQIEQSAERVEELEQLKVSHIVKAREVDSANKVAQTAGKNASEQLEAEIKRRKQAHDALLLKIASSNRSLFQMLALNPLDLSAVANDLGEDVVVVQYLPTPTKLYIQIVAHGGVAIREVKVGRTELLDRALRAARRMAGGDKTTRGFVLKQLVEDEAQRPLASELEWLYSKLLYPVEPMLDGAKRIYIVPSGPLTYLPFGALIRTPGQEPEYAVQRYELGYLSSLYVLELMLKHRETSTQRAVVIADPDGSLPGARAEGNVVAIQYPEHALLVGAEAKKQALELDVAKGGVVHLATHGRLDHQHPERSYLLMADRERITIPDAMSLKLRDTSLVVLSACDSGIGTSGLEYATLARAFMHAGAGAVIATLWEIPDQASRELMTRFYQHYHASGDATEALTKAQRELLAKPGFARPESWAGFVPFGGKIR